MSELTTRPATRADVTVLAGILAAASQDDPTARWVIPDDERRRRAAPAMYRTTLEHVALTVGRTEVGEAGARPVAVAVWIPPGRRAEPPGVQRKAVAAARMALAVGSRLRAAQEVVRVVEAHRPAAPHWYLLCVGSHPAVQRRGYGAALLRHRLEELDRVGLPAYLETSSERTLALYERLGFTVRERLDLPGGGPALWTMLRSPAVTPTR